MASGWDNFVNNIFDFFGNVGGYIKSFFEAPQKNYNLQQEAFDYQKELNKIAMEREDTSYQRQVADLRAAGLSPLMVSGGASAQPLQSAPAPQQDFSQVNSAIQNMFGAFNDIFNRQLNKKQFKLQQQVQTAEMYTKLREFELYKKRQEKEMKILDLDYKYFLNHPERNLGLQQALINALSNKLPEIKNAVQAQLPNISLPGNFQNASVDPFNLFNSYSTEENQSYSLPGIFGIKKESGPTPKQIDKDIEIINKAQKKRVDEALITVNLRKDFYSSAKVIWDYTNASDYYKDYEEFLSVLAEKKNKTKYLETMKIQYKPRKRLELGS